MTTTVEAVERHLATDVALVDALARDVLSLRRAARWLIAEHGWEASEEAVVSALRRYAQDNPRPPITRDRSLLSETTVDVRTGLALVTLPRTQQTHDRIPDVWAAVERLDTIAVVPGRRRLRVWVDADRVEAVEDAVPPGRVESVQAPVSVIQLRLPDRPEAISVVGHATSALVHRGIEVLDLLTCRPEALVLVRDEETVPAFEAVGGLTRQPDVWPDQTADDGEDVSGA